MFNSLLTCSGVAVMGLGIWGACVVEAGLGDGVLAGEAGAKYLLMAGSTSGVPWKTQVSLRLGYCNVELNVVKCLFPAHPLRRVYGRQRIQVRHRELNAFPFKFLINVDNPGQIRAASEGVSPSLSNSKHTNSDVPDTITPQW